MRVVVNPKYKSLQSHIENIPGLFEKEGEIVYDGRNVLKRTSIGDLDVVVKSFKIPHLVNRFVYSYFRESKAARSYLYSMEIMRNGFATPEPIAMIEHRKRGLLTHSYYVCCYDNGETVRDLMGGVVEGNEDKLKAFARFTADLHTAGILHLDYSPGNILVHPLEDGGYHFSLVDVNRMRILSEIDCDTVCRNMCRLCTSQNVLAYIMTEYATIRGWDVKSTVELSLYYTNQFFKGYLFRRAVRKETARHIVFYISVFRLSRSLRFKFSGESQLTRFLWGRERVIYDTYLQQYDYQNIFLKDYR